MNVKPQLKRLCRMVSRQHSLDIFPNIRFSKTSFYHNVIDRNLLRYKK